MKKYLICFCLLFSHVKKTETSTINFINYKLFKFINIVGTVYNPTANQCDNTPLITADNSKINLKKLKKGKLRWVALSRNYLKRWGGEFNYGDTIYVVSTDKSIEGEWVIHDTMNKRYKNNIDFLFYKRKNFKDTIQICKIR